MRIPTVVGPPPDPPQPQQLPPQQPPAPPPPPPPEPDEHFSHKLPTGGFDVSTPQGILDSMVWTNLQIISEPENVREGAHIPSA